MARFYTTSYRHNLCFLLQADQIETKIIHNNYKVLMVGLVELMTSFIKMMLCLDSGYVSRSFLAI